MAHAMERNAKLAEEFLEEMEHEGIATNFSYNTVIKAWKKSGASNMAQRAEAILNHMMARAVDDVVSYTSVVSCVVLLL
jgi:hypothetical protein